MASALDGRVTRGQRNRQAIIDALLACYEAGSLRPSVDEVAARAGLSARSVHNHFADVEALRSEVAQRQWDRNLHRGLPVFVDLDAPGRVDALIAYRADLYEAVTPVRRAALLTVARVARDRVEPRPARSAACGVSSKQCSPTSTTTPPTRSTPPCRGTRGTGCAPRRGVQGRGRSRCCTAPSPRCSKGAGHEWDPPEQGAVPRARERARHRTGRDAQPAEVQGGRRCRRWQRCIRIRQVQRRRHQRWSKRRAARFCGWARPTKC